jgi:hypothetical protein
MVDKLIGANINVSADTLTLLPIAVDSTTAVDLLPARDKEDPLIRATIFNAGNKTLWLRFYPASTDNLLLGERLLPGSQVTFELPNMPLSGVSGIMSSGAANNVYVQYI